MSESSQREMEHATPRRDSPPPGILSTLNDDGSRRWIKPRPSPGRFLTRRRIVAYSLIALFTLIPYISLNGKPLVLLDLPARRFTILGHTFLPTDTLLLALFMMVVFVTIFLLTALFGRVWCGWACPQTVYMEFVYRPIERFFEGTPGRAKKGFVQNSGAGKAIKYVVYFFVSIFLAHTFLAYFVGVEQLRHWIFGSPGDHPVGFMVVVLVTALMMFDFAFFREQTCLVACPYGRFQSVMLDRQSLIVAYDTVRGEPRGKGKSKGDLSLAQLATSGSGGRVGDCVDCGLCVQTCPTGIDIRNGLQMECVHCTQCIDACDAVMTKLKRPTGLIRYSSKASLSGEKLGLLRPRVLVYPTILLVLVSAFVVVFLRQGEADVTLFRGRGAPYVVVEDGRVSNSLKLKIINRSRETRSYALSSMTRGVEIRTEQNPVVVESGEIRTIGVMLLSELGGFERGKRDAAVRVGDGYEYERELHYRLLGPGSTHGEGSHKGKESAP